MMSRELNAHPHPILRKLGHRAVRQQQGGYKKLFYRAMFFFKYIEITTYLFAIRVILQEGLVIVNTKLCYQPYPAHQELITHKYIAIPRFLFLPSVIYIVIPH